MEDVKSTVAKNITELRLQHGMTQLELAERLSYSDKTVSKWERGESTPEISVLVELASLFGVTLDELVSREVPPVRAASAPVAGKYNRRAIAYLSESAAWLVAILAFIITTLVLQEMRFQWLYFIYTLPVALIVRLVFNSVWFNPRHNYPIISLLMWAVMVAVHVTFLYFGKNVALIYLLAVAGQGVIVLWSLIAKPKSK